MFDYCDFVAHKIRNLFAEGTNEIVHDVSRVKLDLHNEGYYLSSKKTIDIIDCNQRRMRVTIEMLEE